ncbi:hypothetical protein KUCAC02_005976, partial [Chaenocephalus aceratus]
DVTDRGALKWRSHLERLMEGPERPGPVVTDWGEFVTREATVLQSHHHKFGGFIHKGEARVMAPMMLYEYSNAAATIRQRVRIRGESYPALNEPQTRSPTGLWVLGLEKPGASCCRSDGRSRLGVREGGGMSLAGCPPVPPRPDGPSPLSVTGRKSHSWSPPKKPLNPRAPATSRPLSAEMALPTGALGMNLS